MQNTKEYFKKLGSVIIGAGKAFSEDKALKYSASLSYYTIFALSPLLVIVIAIASLFYQNGDIQGKVFSEISALIGAGATVQLKAVIANSALSGGSILSLVISIVILMMGASAIFTEIQDTLNIIWRVRPKPKKGFQRFLINRMLSFSMIIGLGFLLIVSLIINGLVAAVSSRLQMYFPEITILLALIINMALTFLIIAFLFGVIFKVLPDVEITWKDVRVGAIATALLFMLGRYLIGQYLSIAGTGSAFGAAGSVIVILTWIYYTAAILYFGAEFTQVYAETFGTAIKPSEYAVYVVQQEQELNVKELPSQGHTPCDDPENTDEDCDDTEPPVKKE